ncbi:MAG: hypothetical protein RR614_11285 [Eubacterium sp.]
MLLTSYYTKSYGQIITENPDQYEQVWTGYLDTKDRRIVGEYIYHGTQRP